MLRIGVIILSVWSALNIALALAFVGSTVLLGRNHPVLAARVSEAELGSTSPNVVATANSMAVFGNGTLVAFGLLVLVAIWKGLDRGIVWVFWALLTSMSVAMLAGFAGDYVSGTSYLVASVPSAVFLAAGFGCAAIGLFHPNRDEPLLRGRPDCNDPPAPRMAP